MARLALLSPQIRKAVCCEDVKRPPHVYKPHDNSARLVRKRRRWLRRVGAWRALT